MKNLARQGVSLVLALVVAASPLMAVTAEASHQKYYGGRGRGRQAQRVQQTQRGSRSYDGYRDGGSYRGGQRQYRTRYVDRHVESYSYRHHHGSSGIGPFIGGLAVGAIIGSHVNSCPPRHQVRRVYVYNCDCCNSYYRDYDVWIDHLVVAHHVPSCEVRDYYPEYDGGYWEEY